MHHRTGAFNWLFESLSWVGTFGVVWVLIALSFALVSRRWGIFIVTVASVAVADLIATILKSAIDIERPSARYALPHPLVPAPHDHSFPSGHAATSFAGATVLSIYAPRYLPVWLLLAVAIAFSRVYVGVHYPLDIVGGAVLGIVVAVAIVALDRRRRRGGGEG